MDCITNLVSWDEIYTRRPSASMLYGLDSLPNSDDDKSESFLPELPTERQPKTEESKLGNKNMNEDENPFARYMPRFYAKLRNRKKFETRVYLDGCDPNMVSVSIENRRLIIEGKKESDGETLISVRHEQKIPERVRLCCLSASLSTRGTLTVYESDDVTIQVKIINKSDDKKMDEVVRETSTSD